MESTNESTGLLYRLGLHRPELRAWALYDWANSAFLCTIITAVYPIYFAQVSASGLEPARTTAIFAGATTVALSVVAVLAPILGALADSYALRKKLLGAFLALGVLATAGLAWTGPGDWQAGALLFILANIGASGSFVFYDSLLPHVARPEEVDRVSTAGYALGYLGGGILLAVNLLWIMKPDLFGFADAPTAMRWSFLSVALWWGLFSIPLLRGVPEPPGDPSITGNPVLVSFRRLGSTFRELKQYKQAFLLLLGFLIYNDGIGTIIRMTSVYGSEIGLESSTMVSAILMVQFLGIPFTFAFGALAGRIGPKNSIMIALAVYVVVAVLAYRMTSAREFYTLAILVAVAQGGCQALSRSLFASLVPPEKTSEFFGFFAVAEKFSGVAGTGIFAVLVALTGSGRAAVLSIVVFFVVGGVFLALVDVEQGRKNRIRATPLETSGHG
ncbi:MAG: MFS transporter [Vulcanimicrobiota bacterium]